MKRAASLRPPDAHEEISGLIETLRATEQRLERLTSGEVDAVADRDGRTFLLRRAQEELRHTEAARQAAILNALPAHIAVLSPQGVILSVNEGWQRFGRDNGWDDSKSGAGVSYLEICDNARGAFAAEARQVAEGIRSVLAGALKRFSTEYSCHSPTEQRWFLLTVTPLSGDRRNGAIVMHLDITEGKQAKAALEELSLQTERRERVLNTTLSCIIDFAYIFDREGRFLFANQPLCDLLAITPEAIVGRNFLELGYPEALAGHLQQQIQAVFATAKSITDETPYTNPAGLGGCYEYIFSPVIAANGSVEFVVGSTRDVTERKLSEEVLRSSEHEQRQLAEQLGIERSRLVTAQRVGKVGSWETDLVSMSVIWSEETYGIFETDPATFHASHSAFLDFVHPDDRARVNEAFRRSLEQRTPSVTEHRVLLPDGRIKFVEEHWQVLFDSEDKPVRAFGTCQDISERTQAAARSRLQSQALDASANAVVITDRDLAIVWINAAFTKLTAYTAEDAIGRNVQDLLRSGVHDPAFYKEIRDTITGGESWSGVMTNRTRDGRLYPEAQTITPVKDSDGTVSHFISIKTDLTAQHLMEAQMRQSQKMEAVGQLAGGVAHEFNNLLQALMSMAAIIRLRTDQTQIAKLGGDMEVQIRRGASLTQQLLQFSRSQPVDKSDLDLGEEVRKSAILLRPIFSENLRIVVETSPERLSVEGDAGQVQQVLLNFAINARDAMPDGGTLTLRAGSCDGEVFLEVEDTGLGVDAATRARMFEPFFTTKDVGKGTGLGLAVVHGIVAQHSGRVEVHSRLGKGTCLRVILPAAARRLETAAAKADDSELLTGTGRVLLVEDEPGVREGIEDVLEMLGYEVVAVGSGEEALALAPELAPHVLLSDVTLAGMEGPTLAKLLRGRWPDMPVVLMSGYLEASLRADVMDRGWLFLQKPFEMVDLARQLRQALEGGTRQRAWEPTTISGNAA